MLRKPVDSTRMRSVGFENNVVEIEFTDGVIYEYLNVSEAEFKEFINSDSLGRALFSFEKKHEYRRK